MSKRTTVIICCVVTVLMLGLGGLVYWKGWWQTWYDWIHDFVIFPELKKPFDAEEAFKSATSAVVSVATSLASEARRVIDKAGDGAKDAANDVKDFFKGIGKRDEFDRLDYVEAIATTSAVWDGATISVALQASRPTLSIVKPTRGSEATVENATTNATGNDAPQTSAWRIGEALWFNQTGTSTGACKRVHTNEDLVFGLSAPLYGSLGQISPDCGRLVEVEHIESGKTLTLPVTDSSGNEYFTLSIQAFRQFAPLRTGLLEIKWRYVGDSSTAADGGASNSTAPAHSGNSTTTARPAGATAVSTATITSAASSASVNSAASAREAAESRASVSSARAAAAEASKEAAASSSSAAAAAAAASASAVAERKEREAQDARKKAEREERERKEAADRKKAAAEEEAAAAAAARQAQEKAEREAREEAERKAREQEERKKREEEERQRREEEERKRREEEDRKKAEEDRKKAEEAKNNSNNGGGNVVRGGFATFYYQNGNPGHVSSTCCGTVAAESDKVIALPTNTYANGKHCGRQIRLTRTDNGRSVVATVRDSCPTCHNDQSLDLSVGAFNAIASESEGMVPIEWVWA
ncbi:hypothetical protein OIV83_005500 [Microbotryomycetes sp. JL201]|nr:hypothetical protein OIV83_005500 [Microbotryomycetes sp. JL201]